MDEELTGGMDDSSGSSKFGKYKTIIIIAIIALAMGAGGFFAGKMLSGGKTPEDPQVVKKEDGQKTNAKQDENSGDQKSLDDGNADSQTNNNESTSNTNQGGVRGKKGILVLDAFTINLNDPFGRRYIEVVINLVTSTKEIVPKIKEDELLLPKIRHEIFMTISAKSFNELKSTAGKQTLLEEIMMRVNEILKEEMDVEPVLEVEFGKFLVQ